MPRPSLRALAPPTLLLGLAPLLAGAFAPAGKPWTAHQPLRRARTPLCELAPLTPVRPRLAKNDERGPTLHGPPTASHGLPTHGLHEPLDLPVASSSLSATVEGSLLMLMVAVLWGSNFPACVLKP